MTERISGGLFYKLLLEIDCERYTRKDSTNKILFFLSQIHAFNKWDTLLVLLLSLLSCSSYGVHRIVE